MRCPYFSLLLAISLSAHGQAFTLRRPVPQPGAGFDPTSISGMFVYWNYKDLSVGSTVSSWVDRIQAIDAHQGNATKQPTNSASGVWFTGGMQLTNAAPNLVNAKFSAWIDFKPTSVTAGFKNIMGTVDGNNGFFVNGPALVFYTSDIGARTLSVAAANTVYDLVFTNNTSGASGASGWTNEVQFAAVAGKGGALNMPSTMGSDNFNEQYQGYIKFIGIWTNKDLTTTDMTNLFNYSQTH